MNEPSSLPMLRPHESRTVPWLHSVLRFGRVVRFRWSLVAATLVAFVLLGLLYHVTAERVYEAHAQLLVQQTGPVVLSQNVPSNVHQQGMLPTYEQLFSSTIVLEGAVQRLNELPDELRLDLLDQPRDRWVGQLRRNLTVRSFRMTDIVEIAYRSGSGEAAEAAVNVVLDSYLTFMKDNHRNVAEELVTILQKERRDVERQLLTKEHALLAAKRELGDLGLRDAASKSLHPLVQRVMRVNEALLEVQQTRLQLQASEAAIRSAAREGSALRHQLFALEPLVGREVVLAALGLSEQDSQAVAQLEQKLIEQQAELEALQPHYGRRHPKVEQLSEAIRQTNVHLANYQETVQQRNARLESPHLRQLLQDLVTQELQKAWTQEQELRRQYDRAQAEAVRMQSQLEEIAMAQREVDRLLNLNHTLLNRIDNIDINQNQSDVRVEVVSRPQATPQPVSPRPILVLLVCLGGGLALGSAIVYVVDVLDDRFRSPEEMKDQLQTPILAMVRQLDTVMDCGLDALQVHVAPDAVESEAFRTLRTTLAFSPQELDCVAVSSAEPGDGKTTVLANLGVAHAQAGKRVLLIDADLRRPGLTRLMDLKGQTGLANLLTDDRAVAVSAPQHVYAAALPGLAVMPSGTRPVDPTGLLASSRFAELLAWAETQYDQVLIDSPPILVASDAAIVGRVANGLMLVVQPHKNHRRLVIRAVEEVQNLGLHLVGIVLNRLSPQSGQAYCGSGYGYGYGYHYGEREGSEVDSDEHAACPEELQRPLAETGRSDQEQLFSGDNRRDARDAA